MGSTATILHVDLVGRQPAIERVFKPTLHHLSDRMGARLHAKSLEGRTITVASSNPGARQG